MCILDFFRAFFLDRCIAQDIKIRFAMLRAKINFSLFKAIFAVLFGIMLCGCEPEDVSREDIPTFLSQYDPAMKAKRDEMVRSLTATREQLSKLRSLQYSYSSERAKSYVGKQISKVEAQEARLADILGKFDASIEVAMAAKEMDAADGGGLHTKESRQIISQADQIVRQSNELSSDVTTIIDSSRSGGNSLNDESAEVAGSIHRRMSANTSDHDAANIPVSVYDFLDSWIASTSSNEAHKVIDHYADIVDFCYFKGKSTKNRLMEGQLQFVGSFPNRSYSDWNIKSILPDNAGGYVVNYSFCYAYSGVKNTSGEVNATITIRMFDGDWKITRYHEKVKSNS